MKLYSKCISTFALNTHPPFIFCARNLIPSKREHQAPTPTMIEHVLEASGVQEQRAARLSRCMKSGAAPHCHLSCPYQYSPVGKLSIFRRRTRCQEPSAPSFACISSGMRSKPTNLGTYWVLLKILAFPVAIRGFLLVPGRRTKHVIADSKWATAEPFDMNLAAYASSCVMQYISAHIAHPIASMNVLFVS